MVEEKKKSQFMKIIHALDAREKDVLFLKREIAELEKSIKRKKQNVDNIVETLMQRPDAPIPSNAVSMEKNALSREQKKLAEATIKLGKCQKKIAKLNAHLEKVLSKMNK